MDDNNQLKLTVYNDMYKSADGITWELVKDNLLFEPRYNFQIFLLNNV